MGKWGPDETDLAPASRAKYAAIGDRSFSLQRRTVTVYCKRECLGIERTSPIDYRHMGLLLKAAEDPEVGMVDFEAGFRVGPGARLPRPAVLSLNRLGR